MKTIRFLLVALLVVAGVSARPNVIFFLVDDWGYKDASFMGSKYYETPNMDTLAKHGLMFTNGYANASNCAPTRAALISGTYAQRTGVYTVNESDRGALADRRLVPIPNTDTLAPSCYTLGEAMRDAGYITASIGKWHLGQGALTGPLGQGFSKNVGGCSWGQPQNGYFSPYGFPTAANLPNGPKDEYLTDRLTTEATKFIKANKDTVFFLYLPHYAVHEPIDPKPGLAAKYKNKPGSDGQNEPGYAAMIESVDKSLGAVVDTLKKLGIYDNTLIILTSDNGGQGEHTAQLPLRGCKGNYYEGGIRVPWVWSWPGKISAGTSNEVIQSFDAFPTLVKLANGTIPVDKKLDGIDISPVLFGTGSLSRQAIYYHFPAYLEQYAGGTGLWRATPLSVIRKGDFKLIEFYEYGQLELYNLKNDIGETKNLARDSTAKYAEKVKELRDDLHHFLDSTKAPIPTTLNKAFVPRAANSPGVYATWDTVARYLTGIKASVVRQDRALGFRVRQAGKTMRFSFALADTREVVMTVCDLRGRQIVPAIRKRFGAGEHEIAMESTALTSQMVFVRLVVGEKGDAVVATAVRLVQ